jgi:hypothetical protein
MREIPVFIEAERIRKKILPMAALSYHGKKKYTRKNVWRKMPGGENRYCR